MRRIIVGLALCGLLGCATAPDKVKPLSVSPVQFQGLACPSLRERQASLNTQVVELSNQQSRTRSHDMVGVVLIGLPVGRMTGGNVEKQLAQAKGEQIAVNNEIAAKGC